MSSKINFQKIIKIFWKKIMKDKCKRELFLYWAFPTISTIWSKKSSFQFCRDNFLLKTWAREARITTHSSAWSELAGALFRYISVFRKLAILSQFNWFIKLTMTDDYQIIKYSLIDNRAFGKGCVNELYLFLYVS